VSTFGEMAQEMTEGFGEVAKRMGRLGTAMRMPGLTLLLCEVLRDESGGDVEVAARSARLVHAWTAAEPEVRAAELLDIAWRSRAREIAEGSLPPEMYAHDLNFSARTHEGDRESFRGPSFPGMPLPGQAGALASSLAFDRDDCEASLKTVLLLLREALEAREDEPAAGG